MDFIFQRNLQMVESFGNECAECGEFRLKHTVCGCAGRLYCASPGRALYRKMQCHDKPHCVSWQISVALIQMMLAATLTQIGKTLHHAAFSTIRIAPIDNTFRGSSIELANSFLHSFGRFSRFAFCQRQLSPLHVGSSAGSNQLVTTLPFEVLADPLLCRLRIGQ